MAFGSFFTKALDVITPWNRGGEVQRRQQAARKKKQDQLNNPAVRSSQNNVAGDQQQQIKAQSPQNLFAGLNQNLRLPGAPQTNLQVNPNPSLAPILKPQPGQVIKPTNKPASGMVAPTGIAGTRTTVNGQTGVMATNAKTGQPHFVPDAPKPQDNRFWQKVGRGIGTVKDTAVGTVANIPEVGLAAARAGTGIVQGAAHLPSLATHALTYAPRKIAGNNSVVNRALSSVNRGVDTATSVVDKPFSFVNRGLDSAARGYANHVPVAAGGLQVYKKEQIPLNVLAGLLTLGGSTAAEAGNAGKIGQVTRFLDKPLASNPNNIISKTGQAINRGAPVAHAVVSPIKSARAGITRLVKGRSVPVVDRAAVDAGEAGNVLSSSQLDELTRPPTQIPVIQAGSGNVPIPVGIPRPGVPIRELGGDTPGAVRIPTAEEVATQRAASNFSAQAPGRPDPFVEGITPRTTEPYQLSSDAVKNSQNDAIDQYASFLKNVGEGNGVNMVPDGQGGYVRSSNNVRFGDTKGRRMTKADWRAEAESQLRAGKAEPSVQKAFDDAANSEVQSLLSKGDQTQDASIGAPITVKQATGIPVTDQTVVPTGLPETPGTVRTTVQTSPMDAKTQAAANTPVVATPTTLPKEIQDVLDNPKQYNKRQVAAARNQRKLAKQLAKTKADTQAVIDNSPELAPKPESGTPGFVPTGEFRRGENGNISEVAHQSTEAAQAAADTANLSSGDVLAKANQDIAQGGRVTPESVRNLQAMLESGRFAQTSPEYRAIAKTLYGAGSDYGRGLSLFNPTLRRTASGDQLANRFVSKLYGVAEDGSKFTDSHFQVVQQAENDFTSARDVANQALDRYNATKAPADFAAWKQARQVADDAEKHSLITEYKVANDVLKGNKNPEALKAIQQAEKDAGVYQMDWVDANMLSGTGTMTRNLMNTSLVRLENRLFGGRGYSSKGAKLGNKIGNRSVVTDFKARSELDQNKLSKTVKQWSTTGNMLGEGNINAVGSARAYKFYEKQLKSQGVTGNQLKMDTEAMLHTDPEGVAQRMEQWALSENALSGMVRSGKIEQKLVDAIARQGGGKLSQTAAKALVRLTVGFPTVIGRSLLGGVKRAGVGVPDLISAGKSFAKGDTQAMKDALYSAKVHAGSGATLYALGTGLAEAGLITPAYPSDPAEQAKWKAEGKQPNSINIGGNWFSIPGYFGALALPLTIPANVMNKTSPGDIVKGLANGIQDLSPTAGLQNFIDGMEGRGGKQWVKNEITSLTRAFTPVGSLLNQIAKMTDPTKNDTTTKDGISNLLDSIAAGIPGVNNAVNKIPATDANGNILHNPNPVATFFGAQGSDQPQGKQDVQQAQSAANDTYKQLSDYGVLQDKSLMGLVDKKIQAQIKRGEDLTPEQVAKVQKAITKGVSATGDDTAYLEKGQYDTNLSVLKTKKDLMSADPTTKPSDLKKMDTAIKRGGVYKDNKISYDMISAYQKTSTSEWRSMGDPESDSYDPDMYQKLWDIDNLMTKAGVSYKTDAPTKNKYSAKKPGKGRGSGVKQLDTSFGTLKAGTGAPTVQQYDTIDAKSGSIPHISVVRPNIVHKIGSS